MMEREILALARGQADAAEVFGEEADRTVVEFRSGKFSSQETRLTHGYGLRVLKDGKLGFSSTTNQERLDVFVEAAVDTSSLGREARFPFPGHAEVPGVRTMDNRVMLYSARRLIDWGRALVDAMRSRVPDMKLDLTFTRTYREVRIQNTSGLDAEFERAELGLSATGLQMEGTGAGQGLVWLSAYVNMSDGTPFNMEPVADRLERLSRMARRRAKLATGEYPVVVMPAAVPDMLLPLAYGVSGKQREKGTSPLIGREGERIASEVLTVADDPLRAYGLGSGPFDGEGIPRRRNVLLDRGAFKGFLFDLDTAAACGARGTASASRSYASQPYPWISNLVVEPGRAELDDVLSGMKQGLLVETFIGGGQSNLMAGDVSLNIVTGFKVENGEVVGRVKDAMVAGNIYDMLMTVDAAGSVQEDFGDHFLPFLRFPALKVATRE